MRSGGHITITKFGLIIMNWNLWRPWYERIASRLDLDPLEDGRAAKALNELLPDPDLAGLSELIEGKECAVLGAGPSLEADLRSIARSRWITKVLITADGATSALLKYRPPDVIVTDLDGNVKDQLTAWPLGSWMVVHAHGDNMNRVREVVPQISERIIGTTQVRPFGKLHNFGGFTDGDRAAFMAHELGASRIYLAGMDLGKKIGRYSGDKDSGRKFIKLEICRELLAWLAGELGAELINITAGGEDIPNVPRRTLQRVR